MTCPECGKEVALLKGIFQGRREGLREVVVAPQRIWLCVCGWGKVEMETEKAKTVSFVASQPTKEKPEAGLTTPAPGDIKTEGK